MKASTTTPDLAGAPKAGTDGPYTWTVTPAGQRWTLTIFERGEIVAKQRYQTEQQCRVGRQALMAEVRRRVLP